jgi:hypothetical protein
MRPFKSEFCSPVLFAKNAHGTSRFCINYQNLNALTEQNFNLPLYIKENHTHLIRSNVSSKIDLMNEFHHLNIFEGNELKTAFWCPQQVFEFIVMPFGLTNASYTFQCFVLFVLSPLIDNGVESTLIRFWYFF